MPAYQGVTIIQEPQGLHVSPAKDLCSSIFRALCHDGEHCCLLQATSTLSFVSLGYMLI